MIKPKRRYSKRRENLVKSFKCPELGCDKEYSSTIALNSHIKKKHQKDKEEESIEIEH